MAPRKTINAIRKRFAENQPLNLSAVENECPELLEGLFQAEDFVGWRATLERAGVDYAAIVTFVSPEVSCRLCEHSGAAIFKHLSNVHGISTAEYREEFPDAEVVSEVKRSLTTTAPNGDIVRIIEPHWEPAWSIKYLLDRLHTFSQKGVPLNYGYYAQNEAGMAAYCRRVFGSWDEGIRQIGGSPENVRKLKEDVIVTREGVIKELKQIANKDPDRITLPILANDEPLVGKCFRVFITYEEALDAAGIDPTYFVPALDDSQLVKKRQSLIHAAKKRLAARDKSYDPEQCASFIDRHQTVISHFYINWQHFARSIGTTTRELFHAPGHSPYDSRDKVVAGLQARAQVGLSIRYIIALEQDRSLVMMAVKHFDNYGAALDAAGLEAPARMECVTHYSSSDEVLREIRRRYENGESLYHMDVLAEDIPLVKWSKHYYGGLREAIVEAGVPDPGIKPRSNEVAFIYSDKAAVIAEIQRRHAAGESIACGVMCKPGVSAGDHTLYLSAVRHCETWLQAVAEAGFPTGILHYNPDSSSVRYYCKEDVIDALQRHENRGGSLAINHRTLPRNKGGLGLTLYDKAEEFFGSFRAAVEAAGIDLALTERVVKVIPMNAEEVIQAIKKRNELNRPLRGDYMIKEGGEAAVLCRRGTRVFKNWGAALRAAGIDPELLPRW